MSRRLPYVRMALAPMREGHAARCPSEEELAVLLDATATASRVPHLLAHLDVGNGIATFLEISLHGPSRTQVRGSHATHG